MFQAGITAAQFTPVGQPCQIQIDDTSNYDASGEPLTHDRAFFDKKRVVVTNPDNIAYIMDSVDIPPVSDESIDPPSSGAPADQNFYNFNGNDGNGTYTVELYTVPTWQNGQTYNASDDHVVYVAGVFYATTIDGNANNPATLTGWTIIDYTTLATNAKYYQSTTVNVTCLTSALFQELLFSDVTNTYSLDVNDTCTGLIIEDESLYADNNEPGHNISDFSEYRTVTIMRPNNGTYVMSSVASLDPDEIISAPSSGNNTINYAFDNAQDEDGLYFVRICAFPTWRDDANYTSNVNSTIVYYNGVLYKMLASNLNQQPDVSPVYWEVFTPDGTIEFTTRYCYIAAIGVLCFDILKCYQKTVHEAFCLMETNHCNDDVLCKNRKFLAAAKIRVLLDALTYSMNRKQWTEVERIFNLLRQLCNC